MNQLRLNSVAHFESFIVHSTFIYKYNPRYKNLNLKIKKIKKS